MVYELWDVETGNIINTYASQAEALAVVRDLLAVNAPEYAEALSLGSEDDRGKSRLIAEGAELARIALGAASRIPARS